MPSQDEIIGIHPNDPNIFHRWFTVTDYPPEPDICHRGLNARVQADDPEVIEWLAQKIIDHHYPPALLRRLRNKYRKLGFPEFAEVHLQIPTNDAVRKGNATEIILIEYIENCREDAELIKTFRLRYNPNVDQSMKGDDALLVEVIEDDEGNEDLKVLLGEAKFRGTPTSAVLNEIKEALGKDKVPLSYSFLIQRLYEDPNTVAIAELLDDFLIGEIKAKGNLRYAGLLLSAVNAGTFVENHFTTDNPAMVIISAGIDEPAQLVINAFVRAHDLINHPDQL